MDAAADRPRAIAPATVLVSASYAVLGSILLVTRLVGLDRSYASDELMTVRSYVTAGPGEILGGSYIPNNHELFSLLGWATTSLVGESAVALRLWSALPFVAGVVLVTAWLHRRLGPPSGLLFLFFTTFSPLLLDITRQARGYGITFLAMSALVVAALEAERTRRASLVVACCAAGVVGTWTLPHFGIAFLATGAVLLTSPELRRTAMLLVGPSVLAIVAWYAPHLDDLARSSQQEYAKPIEPAWVVTAPIDQILLPALRWIDEVLLDPDLASLVATVALALVMAASPLLRWRFPALVLSSGAVVTIVIVWMTRVNVAPRFFSFLLVPLLILLASGTATLFTRFASSGRPVLRTWLAVIVVGLVAVESARQIEDVVRLPREAVREAAELILEEASPGTPVYAYVPYPRDLEHYLGRPVETPRTPPELDRACEATGEIVVVTQPWVLERVSAPCADSAGVRRVRFEQYARGGEINVWFVPPRA